ncbi:hypothetical protein QJS10_CPA01g01500 [Acorus calamus]|uniref:Wall-associated receptor kinase C-terminal domain-containing protein n=1 Tax=Acorus calamus TaxID=4465 RepID=A0AAV9FNB7_ACOCL|nr:hypothetical protein QJS10_CPA01g01500 [Acorus calamus]
MTNTSYQVMNIDYEKQILAIAEADYLTYLDVDETCPPFSEAPAFDSSLFNYTGNDFIVSFFHCTGQDVGDHPVFYHVPPCNQTNHYYTMFLIDTISESYALRYVYGFHTFNCSFEYQFPVHASYVNDLTDNATEYNRVVTLKEALQEGFDLAWIPGKGWCNGCVRSGGRCGYDERKPNDTLCLCPNNSYATSCPLIKAYDTLRTMRPNIFRAD